MYNYVVTLMTGNKLELPDDISDFSIDNGTYMFADQVGNVLASVPAQNVFTVIAVPAVDEEGV